MITKSDISAVSPIDPKISDDFINAMVTEISTFNLDDVVNQSFAIDILDNATTGVYDTLLNGDTYIYSGKTYKFEGLKKWYCYMFLYKFALQGNIYNSRHGQIEFRSNNQNQFEQVDEYKKENAKKYMQYAQQIAAQIQLYLNRNHTLYPLYENQAIDIAPKFKTFKLR